MQSRPGRTSPSGNFLHVEICSHVESCWPNKFILHLDDKTSTYRVNLPSTHSEAKPTVSFTAFSENAFHYNWNSDGVCPLH